MQFDQVGISIINERPEELLYLSLDEFRVEYVDYGIKRSIEFDIKVRWAPFPFPSLSTHILHPTGLPNR